MTGEAVHTILALACSLFNEWSSANAHVFNARNDASVIPSIPTYENSP